ncbi:TetR/AcrR family transcriptional regulator [Streptomyces sp. SID3343]|uniref:TetR/AcrR family transcriptional regulator n=1 Tax=Streptomyces sp. SID3343 TaxID=2690260 RepID=UPI001370EC64|nr:TetR/AcrR family transcriptional regulator [Streptomyces sp. SID3343]MYV97793.1 TetR family transcriptional regulator [Streptomyces sp. SID3343]
MESPREHSRGKRRDADATRAALLDAARALFGRHGYEAVTLRDIGERAGADGSLVARYFGNKAALYRSAVAEDGREAAASPGGLDLGVYTVDALRRADLRGAPGPLVQALLSQGSTPEVRASAAEEMRTHLVLPLATRLAAEGAADPEAGAEALVACLVGVIALRTSGLFAGLSGASRETVGLMLDAAAQAWPAAATAQAEGGGASVVETGQGE